MTLVLIGKDQVLMASFLLAGAWIISVKILFW